METHSINEPSLFRIEESVLLKELEPTVRQQLAQRFTILNLEAGAVLFVPGQMPDHLYLMGSGKAVVEAMGSEIENPVLAELTAGNFFPVEALFQNRPVFSTFRVVEDSTLYRLSESQFKQSLADFPTFRRFCELRANTLVDQTRKLYTTQLSIRPDYQSLDTPLATIVQSKPVTSDPSTPLKVVLAKMNDHPAEVAVIVDNDDHPLGIFTLRDLLQRVALGEYPLESPVEGVMTRELHPLEGKLPGSHAALEMARHGVKQVVVVDQGKVIGLVSERDLFGLQKVGLAQIAAGIQQARTEDSLIRLSDDIRKLSHNLLDQGVGSEQLTQIISTLNDQLTEQILRLTARSSSLTPIDFCWLALGSEGRHEQTLSSDQDNAIIFRPSEGISHEEARQQLLGFAQKVNSLLDQCGFPLCKGGIMAGNSKWCLSLEEWEKQFNGWINTPEPEAILNATIFFDFRPLHGHKHLATQLRNRVARIAKQNRRFLHLMVESALDRSPPLGLLRDFVTANDGTIDLKLSGIALFVDAARIFSLAHEIVAPGTRPRLRQISRFVKIPGKEVEAWNNAFDFLQHLRMRIQHEQHMAGRPVSNKIDPASLNDLDRRFLLESLRQAGRLQKRLHVYKISERNM
ncbi:MAG: CBS domain-containing protein [Magnetococcales bacterium]|nr:CBS domain-containing protein [Magnetococcales bacterium]NGZ25570.1 CBS domain-containing protein [Magnetococcales bacterium]